MRYTPAEVAALLANRPNQPHYVKALIEKCVKAAVLAAPAIAIDSTRSAAVDQGHCWIDIDKQPPPAGVKLLLINRANGVACLGTYHAKHQWTHWQGLPKFHDQVDQKEATT